MLDITLKSIGVNGYRNQPINFATSNDILDMLFPDGVPVDSATIQVVDYKKRSLVEITIFRNDEKLNIEIENKPLGELDLES